jgi:diadenosine tetraphosphate (Ap4A) HIT family hydrolase
MRVVDNCNICEEISGSGSNECGHEYQELIRSRQNILLSSPNFAVIPSVGPLHVTHAMIVPLRHVNSFAELSKGEIDEADELLQKLQNHITGRLGAGLLFFESGAGRLIDRSGGCIAHAHIHCVTDSPDFFERISVELPLVATKYMDFTGADTENGYIWFRSSAGNCYISNRPLLPSQFLRYVYAQCSGSPMKWNWRRHTNFTEIREVVALYNGIR